MTANGLLCATVLSEVCVEAADAAGRTAMKKVTIDRKDPASVEEPVTELIPPLEPPAARHTRKIMVNVFGRRFELRSHVEVREITKGPAKVIEMPRRPKI
jgi:hypothetical protein